MAESLECVWMQAGVLDYRLCDRLYRCDGCPLDSAMRRAGTTAGTWAERRAVSGPPAGQASAFTTAAAPSGEVVSPGRAVPRFIGRYEIPRALFYDRCHTWLRVEGGGKVRVGLDDFATKLVGRVYAVRLPKPGTRVTPRSTCWSVVHAAGESCLKIPVAGTVCEVNEKLPQEPSLLGRDPYGQASAMVVEPTRLQESLKRLIYGEEAEAWISAEAERLETELRQRLQARHSPLGITLQDGGERVEDLSLVIGVEGLREVLGMFLSDHGCVGRGPVAARPTRAHPPSRGKWR